MAAAVSIAAMIDDNHEGQSVVGTPSHQHARFSGRSDITDNSGLGAESLSDFLAQWAEYSRREKFYIGLKGGGLV